MVEIKKLMKGAKEYYYLVHSYRDGKKVRKKEEYLGGVLPKDVEEKKKKFMHDFYKEKFLSKMNQIKKNFSSEYKQLPESAKEKSKETFAVKFTYNTQRIEGSTLTLKETANLLEKGITPSARPIRDIKEAEAHRRVFFDMVQYSGDLNLQIVLEWHKELMKETKEDIAGRIRDHNVAISQSKFQPPTAIELEMLLKEFFGWYSREKKRIHPVELAALVHLKFVTIHPFTDGNGRISRLMMNFVLKKNKFPLLDVPYTKRAAYYNALERSQVRREDKIFIQWLFRRYIQEYKKYVKKE